MITQYALRNKNVTSLPMIVLCIYCALTISVRAQVVPIPDSTLRAAIARTLNIPRGASISREDIDRLTHLDVTSRGITDLTGLDSATNLISLRISDNPITDLRPLAALVRLEELSMWSVRNADITPLAHLTDLRGLDIAACNIDDITPLTALTRLTGLNIRANYIVDIRPLANLKRLENLHANDNRITDVTPLAGLPSLDWLEIHHNQIADHSPLDALALSHFTYDQTCEMPPLPLEPRIENRTYPSIFTRWGPHIDNRPDLSRWERTALHDLWYDGSQFDLQLRKTSQGIAIAGMVDQAIQQRDTYLSINPNMVFIVDIRMREYWHDEAPEDWIGWIRNANGERVSDWPDAFLVDFTHPAVQDRIVQQAIAVSRCGLYDGIFFDWWSEKWPVLTAKDETSVRRVFRGMEAEQRARDTILQRIRAATRPNFLIMGNTNIETIPRTAPHVNGSAMETVMPADRNSSIQIERDLNKIEDSLLWLDQNLREPRVNGLEGWVIPSEPPDSPDNLRWMRAFTTLSLTHSDGYVVFKDILNDYHHWYDFWDADLGRPIGDKAQLYHEDIPGLYIREFTNGWAVYNHSGALQEITLPEEVTSVATGLTNTVHSLPNIDGGIYLKKTAPVDTPDASDSDINVDTPEVNVNVIDIANPIDVLPGAALHFDASNNPGSIASWVNLGAAGGRLLAADAPPLLEDGEIEIPSIGFSGRRQYYTPTASRQTFGGPVRTNPNLYVGDWTLEFLCKRNGNLFAEEHQFAGFQNSPRERLQGIRLRLPGDGRELSISLHADGFKFPDQALNVFLDEDVWTWVTVVSINGESIIAYQDGVEVSRHPGVHFDASLPLDDISIGANSYDERHRNFNGSFSIVRVYDRALSPDEVLQNIGATVIPPANPADLNADGVVNIFDLMLLAQAIGTENGEGDVNGDGVVNVFDLVFVANQF